MVKTKKCAFFKEFSKTRLQNPGLALFKAALPCAGWRRNQHKMPVPIILMTKTQLIMNKKTEFIRWLTLAASLCAASNFVQAATNATFTDTWKDAPAAFEYPETTGSFSFKISLPLAAYGPLDITTLDSNSLFSISIGPAGNPVQIVSDTLGDALKFTTNKNGGSALFPILLTNVPPALTTNGSVTVSWTATTITVTGTSSNDILREEALFVASSVQIPASNTFAKEIETNEVSVTLDASDNGGGTFSYNNPEVPQTTKNTETEYTNPNGSTVFLEAGSASGATAGVSYTDTWKDAPASQDYAITAGSFTFKVSLPLDTNGSLNDITTLDSNSVFSISIGPTGSPVSIVSNTLGEAGKFTTNKSGGSAVFPIILTEASGVTTTNGSATVSWTATTLTVTGSSPVDLLFEKASFAATSDGIPADNTFAKMLETNEVSVVLDASDNGGGTFSYDNPDVPATTKNTETEYTNPGDMTFPLETGSSSGAAGGVSYTDTWKDSPATDDQAETTGSGSLAISLPLEGLPFLTNTGLDPTSLDSNSLFSISIGPTGSLLPIVSNTLGGAFKFTTNKNGGSAAFPILVTNVWGALMSNGSVTVSWTAAAITVAGSSSADFLGQEPSFATNSTGTPATQPISKTYELSLVLDATDNGGGMFAYDNTNVPVAGKNTETEHTNADGSAFALEAGTMTGTADFIPPTVTITSPKADFAVYNQDSIINLEGTAKDNVAVAGILYYVNGDTSNLTQVDQGPEWPTNSLSWTAEVDLSQPPGQPGTNVITVYAMDTSGNVSASVSRTFLWIQTNAATVTINPAGAGTVKGLKTGQVLQVGNNYSVTATPANKTWIFSQWTDATGDVLSSNATFEYFDTDGALTANFVNNPFTNATLAGTYTGLFFDPSGAEPIDSGYISIKLTGAGGYSGQLYVAPSTSLISIPSGQLVMSPDDSAAGAAFTIKVSKTEYLDVNVLITNLSDPDNAMLGGFVNAFSDATMTNLLDSAALQGGLAFYNTNIAAKPYNMYLLPNQGDPSQSPGGYSYGTATVSKTGGVVTTLYLADGTSPMISFSSSLANSGYCPFYASLYSGDGVILGWLQFAADGSGGVNSQPLDWVKLPVKDNYYTNGFTNIQSITGSLYVPPNATNNIFGATNLTFVVDQGYYGLSLADELDVPVTYNPSKFTFTVPDNSNKVSLTFTSSSGALSGSFIDAVGSKTSFTYKGVVAGGVGYGFYTSTNKETGPIILNPPLAQPVAGDASDSLIQAKRP
jgi:hypothetical protein